MQIINKVTIKYFRSLHYADLKKCSSINIISGRNDVGKSNIIKSLNLFFNGQTDWESSFDFYDNFSKKRLEEVRKESVKGKQFISITIEFIRPTNYKGSLPEKFNVERKWYRDSRTYEQSNNLASLEKAKKLPSTLTTAQRSLATFLNKIHFEYVPAIRDRAYVNELLSRLQRTLLDSTINQNEALLATANTLAEHIEGQIGDLKSDFESATHIETSITPPSNISALFQSFLVSTKTSDGSVPLRFRGDGLQSRYIASVLYYIAINTNDFYIWGYEEPEIALEYSHVTNIARDFHNKYSDRAQIFVSTHSPAFIALEGEKVSCYRISQENSDTIVANIALSEDFKHKEKLKEELGILEIQKEVHEFYSSELEKLNNLNTRIRELETEANERNSPLIVTEGRTDKEIIDEAFKKTEGTDISFLIRACDNSGGSGDNGGAGTLARLIESIHPEDNRLVIAIFDNDDEGQSEFKKLSKNFSTAHWNEEVKQHKNRLAWAVLLPEPEFRKGFVKAKNLCIEYLFDDEILAKPFSDGKTLEIKPAQSALLLGNQRQENLPFEITNFLQEEAIKYRKIGAGKDKFFKEIIKPLKKESFSAFLPLIEILKKISSTQQAI
ncbi:ATP-binding protein [Pseudomonas sp. MM211]|uniref:ATP-dependent nuclease n=1 Tax=Pseudomonas sp. MM211 TaxID=2866808 RepID=UPI001CED65F3|nr:AAA family ATPase [Pseudomonas sp. MM211]UCJ18447.1 ATP-binding protein [Pseudomonas sp. MM211]